MGNLMLLLLNLKVVLGGQPQICWEGIFPFI